VLATGTFQVARRQGTAAEDPNAKLGTYLTRGAHGLATNLFNRLYLLDMPQPAA
jgi:hypothetical protein